MAPYWPVILGCVLAPGLAAITVVAHARLRAGRLRLLEVEHALRASEERFRAIVESTHEWIWEIDSQQIVTYTNPAVVMVLGVQPTDVRGSDHFARVHPDDRQRARLGLQAAIAARTGWTNVVLRWHARDGTIKFLESNAVPVLDAGGALVGFRGSDRDITERRHADAMKSDFVSFVSHQLRTPLSGVSWMLELAAESPGLTAEVAGHVCEARESAHRLIRLVNDLLDVARLESGRLVMTTQPLQLGELVERVVDELRPLFDDKALRVTVTGPTLEPAVLADGPLMRQAITNLLANAIKYTPCGGEIAVTLTARDGRVTCAVRDTGIGVPRAAQARLFEKFYRADNAVVVESEGTGLGLSLVRLVVEQCGGRVWCESALGEGALFTIELPAAAHAAV